MGADGHRHSRRVEVLLLFGLIVHPAEVDVTAFLAQSGDHPDHFLQARVPSQIQGDVSHGRGHGQDERAAGEEEGPAVLVAELPFRIRRFLLVRHFVVDAGNVHDDTGSQAQSCENVGKKQQHKAITSVCASLVSIGYVVFIAHWCSSGDTGLIHLFITQFC